MSEVHRTDSPELPNDETVEAAYNVLMVAASILEEVRRDVRTVARACDAGELAFDVGFAGIGAVAAIAADVRLRVDEFKLAADELDASVCRLDEIRRLQRDACW